MMLIFTGVYLSDRQHSFIVCFKKVKNSYNYSVSKLKRKEYVILLE